MLALELVPIYWNNKSLLWLEDATTSSMPFSPVQYLNLNDRNWFRVSELWDDDLYRQLRRNLDGGRSSDKREARFEKVRRILEYEVPLVKMVNHSFEEAVTAFTRINTLGVRLKQEDIESAKVAARHSGFIADEVAPFLDHLKHQGFTRLNVMHLFRACAFVARPDGRNRTPLHELEQSEVLAAWKKTQRFWNHLGVPSECWSQPESLGGRCEGCCGSRSIRTVTRCLSQSRARVMARLISTVKGKSDWLSSKNFFV